MKLDWVTAPLQRDRLMIIKRFLSNAQGWVLDSGCGEIEPKIVCDHQNVAALDIAISGLRNLKRNAFKGHLVLGSSTNLPFKDKYFTKSVCSEVIEHLPTEQHVKRCIRELERVSEQFMITTPNNRLDFRWIGPTHRRFFSIESIKKILPENSLIGTSNVGHSSVPILPYFLLDKRYIGRYFEWLDRKLRKTWIGILSTKIKSPLIGGAFIVAICGNKSR